MLRDQEKNNLFAGSITSQQQANVSQGQICSDNFTCCHTEIEVADQTFYLTQSQYTDTGPTSPSANPTTPGAWQGSHWSAKFWVIGMTPPRKNPAQAGIEPGIFRSRGGRLTTRPTRWSKKKWQISNTTYLKDNTKEEMSARIRAAWNCFGKK